jgi:AAA domain-containing protein
VNLLRAISRKDPDFCGSSLAAQKVLILTEEEPEIWKERMTEYGLDPSRILFLPGPDGSPRPRKTTWNQWVSFIEHLVDQVRQHEVDLIVLDTVTSFWPGDEENNNNEVRRAGMDLRAVTQAGAAVLLVHHTGKSGTTRGASEWEGTVDVVIRLHGSTGKKRILAVQGRTKPPPPRTVELTDAGYVPVGRPNKGAAVWNEPIDTVRKNADRVWEVGRRLQTESGGQPG